MSKPPLLEVRDLHMDIRRYGAWRARTPILRGVELTVEPGEVRGLVGESGAGKSMIGRLILGIPPRQARVTGGTIRFEGRDLLAMRVRDRRDLMGVGMALIPQDPMTALNPAFRIGGQITDVMKLHLGIGEAEARVRARDLLDAVHIRGPERVMKQYPHELSGGMRQRVLIAVAFACKPKLIVADEPTTALDVTVQRQVLRLIRDLQKDFGTALLFVTHDLGVVAKICDRVTVLHAGRVLEEGTVRQVIDKPKHPYSKALKAATPRYDQPGNTLQPVPAALTEKLLAEAAAYDERHAAEGRAGDG